MTVSIALAQVNPTVGDVRGNASLVRRMRDHAAAQNADLVVFPELVLVGYPPEDLVLRPALVDAAAAALADLVRESARGGPGLLVTLPWRDGPEGCSLRNAVALVADGTVTLRFKHELPNYGVFDERRLFVPGQLPDPVVFRGVRIGVPICEDIWLPDVTAHLAQRGAELLLVPNGSPFEVDKFEQRLELARARAAESNLPLVYVNQVGGQDELVFDGGSFAVNPGGEIADVMPFWSEALTIARWDRVGGWVARGDAAAAFAPESRLSAVYHAMMLGLRDYVDKNRFPGVLIGLSGGIDSALTAAVAVDAVGAGRVRGVRLPSRFTTDASMVDADETSRLLGIRLETLPIDPGVRAAEGTLEPLFAGRPRDVTEENLQARLRGLLLRARAAAHASAPRRYRRRQ